MGQPALGFALGKLQTADVLQTSSVLAHLFVDDQLHAPADKEKASQIRMSLCCTSQPTCVCVCMCKSMYETGLCYSRCGFANVLHAQQRVDGVVAAKDAGGEDDGEGIGRHPVCLLLQGDPEAR